MTHKVQFGIRLDEETLVAIKKIAEDENRSTNNLIEYLIKKHIKEVNQATPQEATTQESPKDGSGFGGLSSF